LLVFLEATVYDDDGFTSSDPVATGEVDQQFTPHVPPIVEFLEVFGLEC
jgi:hypothetical protein